MYYRLPVVLSLFRIPKIHLHFPALDYDRSCKSLHTHVLDAQSGCSESQEDPRRPVLAAQALLRQQCRTLPILRIQRAILRGPVFTALPTTSRVPSFLWYACLMTD